MGQMFTEVIRTGLVSASYVAKPLLPDDNFSDDNEVRREKRSGRNWRSLLIYPRLVGVALKTL